MKITSFRAIIHLKNKKEALILENIISYQFITNAPFLYIQHKGSFKPDKSQGYYLERKRWFPDTTGGCSYGKRWSKSG